MNEVADLQQPTTMGVLDSRGTSGGARHGMGDNVFHYGVLVLLGLVGLMMIVPFLNVLALAFSSPLDSMQTGIHLWPTNPGLEGFRTVWTNVGLSTAFKNSVIVTFFGTIAHVTLCCLAGYVMIQKDMPGRRLILFFILATMAIPGELIMIPLYIVNRNLHLLNTLYALIISGMVSGFSILLLRNFFAGVPVDLAESARIDGANELRIFWSIYLPLSQAGIATITLFEMVGRWNQFLSVILYISDSSKYTLQVTLRTLVTENLGSSGMSMITPNVRMAGIIIAILPLVVIYPFVQRFFVQGITLGSVKE